RCVVDGVLETLDIGVRHVRLRGRGTADAETERQDHSESGKSRQFHGRNLRTGWCKKRPTSVNQRSVLEGANRRRCTEQRSSTERGSTKDAPRTKDGPRTKN